MQNITRYVRSVLRFRHCTQGSVGIEYAMVAALVSAAFLTTMTALGQDLDTTYSRVAVAFEGAADTPPADVPEPRGKPVH